jgi:hypothetical protein
MQTEKGSSSMLQKFSKDGIMVELQKDYTTRKIIHSQVCKFILWSFFYCTNFGHKVADCRDYERNNQARNAYVAPQNIECYKCHNYGHTARNCRSMIRPPMKENVDVGHKKVWRRSEKQEEKVNEEQVQGIVLSGFAVAQDHDEFTGKRKVSEFKWKMKKMSKLRMMTKFRKRMKGKMYIPTKRKMTLHQSGYCSEPFGLETP